MTKMIDWDRFQSMSSRQKSDVNTETMFSEQRSQNDEQNLSTKDIGLKKMEEEVNIDWGEDENKSK
jgi:hypothetical protein